MDKYYKEFEVCVQTNMSDFKDRTTIKFFAESWEKMTDSEKVKYIEDVCIDVAFDMVEWAITKIMNNEKGE